eukprot:GILJ01009930.1.p1 GENE.GILJ01009930.1~~GILJ01009930.1.p1  ORF type:complete len:806 (-),score=169.06 GILJ01009930.1:132-2549(-)
MRRHFNGPMEYRPDLARSSSSVYSHEDYKAKLRAELGFASDDSEEADQVPEEQEESAHAKMARLEQELNEAKLSEQRTAQQLAQFQQLTKSQMALVKSELQKKREQNAALFKKLKAAASKCAKLRAQSSWYFTKTGVQAPAALEVPEGEDDDAVVEEGGEIDLNAALDRLQRDSLTSRVPQPSSSSTSMDSEDRARELQEELERCRERGRQELAAVRQQQDEQVDDLKAKLQMVAEALKKERAKSSKGVPSDAGHGESAVGEVQVLREQVGLLGEREAALQQKLLDLAKKYKALQADREELKRALNNQKSSQPSESAIEQAVKAKLQSVRLADRDANRKLLAQIQSRLKKEREALRVCRNQISNDLTKLPQTILASIVAEVTTAMKQLKDQERFAYAKYKSEMQERKRLYNMIQDLKGNIRVYCRVRPLGAGEAGSCVQFTDEETLSLTNPVSLMQKSWQFDKVFGPESSQAEVFADTQPLITSVLDGYNVCIFAYGQTGSGKTHTMQGPSHDKGVYFRAMEELFNVIQQRTGDFEYSLSLSLLEIYNESIRDLLVSGEQKSLTARQGANGMFVPDLTIRDISNLEDVYEALSLGVSNRAVGTTNMNEHSSRSHLMLSIYVVGRSLFAQTTWRGKLHLVDLAGSERLSRSGATGDRMKEAQHINKSLSALGDVIAAKAQKTAHVPYRNSTLTFLLSDSLSADSKTLMFLNIAPATENHDESTCSLNFATRVKSVELGQAIRNVSVTGTEEPRDNRSTTTAASKRTSSVNLVPKSGQASGRPSSAVERRGTSGSLTPSRTTRLDRE